MNKYEAIIKLINDNADKVDFGPFGEGRSDFWIDWAQKRLNVSFPPSYIWWLKNYGGGEIIGDEIYSVYEKENAVGGDIVYVNELDRKNGFFNETQLTIQNNDFGETYYFDLLQQAPDGECPVYRDFGGDKSFYAKDFLDFLSGRILDE